MKTASIEILNSNLHSLPVFDSNWLSTPPYAILLYTHVPHLAGSCLDPRSTFVFDIVGELVHCSDKRIEVLSFCMRNHRATEVIHWAVMLLILLNCLVKHLSIDSLYLMGQHHVNTVHPFALNLLTDKIMIIQRGIASKVKAHTDT